MYTKPNFGNAPIFILMRWADDHNFNEECDPIIPECDMPGDFNPFETMPDNYSGSCEEWYTELDSFEVEIKRCYREVCDKIYDYRIKHKLNVDKFSLNLG